MHTHGAGTCPRSVPRASAPPAGAAAPQVWVPGRQGLTRVLQLLAQLGHEDAGLGDGLHVLAHLAVHLGGLPHLQQRAGGTGHGGRRGGGVTRVPAGGTQGSLAA